MDQKYPLLMQPSRLGPWEMSNRVIMAPMGSLNADENGYVTDRAMKFYEDMAHGDISMVVVECTYIDEILSKGEENSLGLTDNGQITGMRMLAERIQDYGVKAVLQLCHIGKQLSLAGKCESMAPSEMTEMVGGVMPFPYRGMTHDEILQVIDDFGSAAWRAKMAGFDGVQIHGSIGHLINMFCNPFFNHRTDEYGGSPENRVRLFTDIIAKVQETCGRDFPIIARIAGYDFDPDGITPEEGIAQCKILDKTGVVAMHICGGSMRNVRCSNIQYDKRGDFIEIAQALKDAGIKTPIILDGGLSIPALAESVLESGAADYIGLGRPMLADPEWARKVKEGRPEDIVPCIRCCMGCVGTIETFNASIGLRCSVNPTCNLTGYRISKPAEKIKNVCIVGGGPGGMEAAKHLVERGHKVTLYEKDRLGGFVHQAAFDPKLKGDLNLLIDYYATQMEKLPVNVVHEEATADKIIAGGYDVVIDATGAQPIPCKVKGSDRANVYTIDEYTADPDKAKLGDTVCIVGGCFPNMEIALSLAQKGKKVIVSTRKGTKMGMFELGADNSSPMQQRLITLLMPYQPQLLMGKNIREVTDTGIIVADTTTKETMEVPCDSVIICRGFVGRAPLYNELQDKVPEVYKIGDSTMKSRCIKSTTVGDAIHAGWLLANRI